jgi:hypothetical protein
VRFAHSRLEAEPSFCLQPVSPNFRQVAEEWKVKILNTGRTITVKINSDYIAPCGLYCGVCAILYATQENNTKFKEKLVGLYKGRLPESDDLSVEDIRCEGCLSEEPFIYCKKCDIKDCAAGKGYSGCHECRDFPCALVENFPMPVGKKVILRAVPHWRDVGTEKWVEDEEARYICPTCGHKLFRGAKRCNKCKAEVDLDG